jgi:hypothetical protein
MNESKQPIATEAPDAEFELSAQDLLDLSAPGVPSKSSSVATKRPRESSPKTASIVATPSAPTRHRMPASGLYLSLALAFGVIGAAYVVVAPGKHADQISRLPPSQLPASAPTSEGAPIRFANPFDAKEVFEFPAGTTEAEARDAVAEILMERAMERQRHFDARVSNNR